MLVLAYGSNMSTDRIRARVPSARFVGIGHVVGWRFGFDKLGADGSAKANVTPTGRSTDHVWGVLFDVDDFELCVLDEYEPHYDRRTVEVVTLDGSVDAAVYVARPEVIERGLIPASWYRGYVVRGAEEHGLPGEYRSMLRSFAPPNRERSVR